MTIHLILPDPSIASLDESFSGAHEMKRFWRSGDFLDFPENPHVFVVVDWLLRVGQEGFADELAMLGADHQAVIDQVLIPAENGRLYHLAKTHPLKLLHCLWRIAMAHCSHGNGDEPRPMADEDFAGTRHIWSAFLGKLRGRRPRLVFHTAQSDFALTAARERHARNQSRGGR